MGTGTTPQSDDGASFGRRLLGALKTFLAIRVKMWMVLIGVVAISAVIWSVSENVKAVDARQRDDAARAAIASAYAADLRTYDIAVQARSDCLDRVTRSDANRAQHQAIVDGIRQLFPGSDVAAQFADRLENGPLLGSPPFTVDECPDPPVPPAVPPELGGAP